MYSCHLVLGRTLGFSLLPTKKQKWVEPEGDRINQIACMFFETKISTFLQKICHTRSEIVNFKKSISFDYKVNHDRYVGVHNARFETGCAKQNENKKSRRPIRCFIIFMKCSIMKA